MPSHSVRPFETNPQTGPLTMLTVVPALELEGGAVLARANGDITATSSAIAAATVIPPPNALRWCGEPVGEPDWAATKSCRASYR